MSAEGHREHSETHGDEAAKHDDKYDPKAERTRPAPGSSRGTSPPRGIDAGDLEAIDLPDRRYNPTAAHKRHAAQHRRHAEAHAAAAETLERFEAAECAGVTSGGRASCPLLSGISAIVDVPGGVRVRFEGHVDLDATAARLRCHFAFGRTQGREGMDPCPLYLKGLSIALSTEGDAIDITGADEAATVELRRRMASHFGP